MGSALIISAVIILNLLTAIGILGMLLVVHRDMKEVKEHTNGMVEKLERIAFKAGVKSEKDK